MKKDKSGMNFLQRIKTILFGKRHYFYFSEPYFTKGDVITDESGAYWVRKYKRAASAPDTMYYYTTIKI